MTTKIIKHSKYNIETSEYSSKGKDSKRIKYVTKGDNTINFKFVDRVIGKVTDKYKDSKYFIKVHNGHRHFTITENNVVNWKGFEEYYQDEVKDINKFISDFESVEIIIITDK